MTTDNSIDKSSPLKLSTIKRSSARKILQKSHTTKNLALNSAREPKKFNKKMKPPLKKSGS